MESHSRSPILLLLITISLLPFAFSISPASAPFSHRNPNSVLNAVCSETDHADLCISSILPLLNHHRQSNAVVTPVELLRLALYALSHKANETMKFVNAIVANPQTPFQVAEVMDTCLDNYVSLIDDVAEAEMALDAGDFGRFGSVMSASIADVATCSDTFAEQPGLVSPVAEFDGLLTQLCSNVLAINYLMKMY